MLLGEVKVYAKKPRSTLTSPSSTGAGCLALVVALIYLPKTVASSLPLYVRSRECARANSHGEHRSHTAPGANASRGGQWLTLDEAFGAGLILKT